MTVKEGSKIKVEYKGSFDDGTVFDSSAKHGKPLELTIGSKQVIKGFEEGLMGMKVGEEKKISLEPKEAYGDYNPQLIQKIPREHLPKEQEPKTGMMLLMGTSDGMQVPVKITEVTDKDVSIDMNHPMVGKKLNFKLKVVEIN